MLAVLMAATLCAAPEAKVKLAVLDIQGVGVEPKLSAFFGEHLATQLKLAGLEVVTTREINSLLGLERQKALLGCSEQAASCMAELASAMGADGVVLTDVARLGSKTQVNLKVISGLDGRTLAVWLDRVSGDEEVADALERGAGQLAKDVLAALRPGSASRSGGEPQLARSGGGLKRLWWAPTAGGGALLLTGAVLFGLGKADYGRLNSASGIALGEAVALREGGRLKQTSGVALLVSGAAVAAVGVGLLLFGGSGQAQVAVMPVYQGGALVVSGGLP